MIIHEMEQRSDAWFEVKKGKFSASDANTIQAMGKGLDSLVYKKVAEILSGKDQDEYTNGDMERGVENESFARNAYEIATGNIVKQVGFVELDAHTGCSPDGLVGDDGLVEIKCQRGYKYVEIAITKEIDKKYLDQMQMQMLVTGRKWCDYVCYDENFPEPVIIRVDADPEMQVKIKRGLDYAIKKLDEVMGVLKCQK